MYHIFEYFGDNVIYKNWKSEQMALGFFKGTLSTKIFWLLHPLGEGEKWWGLARMSGTG